MKTSRARLYLTALIGWAWVLSRPTAVTAAEGAPDWPRFRGPGGLGVSAEKGLPLTWSSGENIVWKTALPGAGTSSPVILGDRIFLTGYFGLGVPTDGRDGAGLAVAGGTFYLRSDRFLYAIGTKGREVSR